MVVYFQAWQVLLTCFLTHGPCNSLPCCGILVNRYFNFIYSFDASFAASSSIAINWSCSFVLQEFWIKYLPQVKFPCLFVILFNAYLSFLLLRQLCLFDCYAFSCCFLLLCRDYNTIFLSRVTDSNAISIVIFRFHRLVRGIFFRIVLYIFSVSLSFLLGFCEWFPRIFSSALLVPTSFLTYCLAFLVFFSFFPVFLRSSRSSLCLSREPHINFVNCISFVCRFSLTRSRVAVLKGSQFPSQLFEAQSCHPRSHFLHFYLPLCLFFQPPFQAF